jgi:hypothetical protein
MSCVLVQNVVHVLCSGPECGTCLMFCSRMWYMSYVLVQNVVHVLCSGPECGTCLMLWSRMWYKFPFVTSQFEVFLQTPALNIQVTSKHLTS